MRLIFLALILMTMLSGCSVVNSLRMMHANDHLKPTFADQQSNNFQQSIEAHYIGKKPYINVRVNDETELLFLIDTGASFTMLFDTEKTASLDLQKGFALEMRGWGDGDNTPAFQTQLESLAIGGALFNDVNVGYIPISTSQYYLVPEEAIFDGVLGHDLLRHFNWMFDKHNKKITVSNASYGSEPGDVQVPFDTFMSKITMPVSLHINEKTFVHEVYIDTGSRHYFKFNTAFVENRDIELPETFVAASDFGLSGEAKHIRIRLPGLSVGDMKLKGVKANIIKADDEDDFSVVGSALMSQFVTIIDYEQSHITFRPYPNHVFKSQFNLAGLDLRKLQNGKLIVRYVFPGLVAAKNGFEAGAIVTSINKVNAEKISEEDWLHMSDTAGEFELCFEVGPCKVISTQPLTGYSLPAHKS